MAYVLHGPYTYAHTMYYYCCFYRSRIALINRRFIQLQTKRRLTKFGFNSDMKFVRILSGGDDYLLGTTSPSSTDSDPVPRH